MTPQAPAPRSLSDLFADLDKVQRIINDLGVIAAIHGSGARDHCDVRALFAEIKAALQREAQPPQEAPMTHDEIPIGPASGYDDPPEDAPAPRSLSTYRPQHDYDCGSLKCAGCDGFFTATGCACGASLRATRKPCTCGLDLALQREAQPPQETNNDAGAGLIHQTIPDVDDTEPRLSECECGHGWHLHSSAGCMAMRGRQRCECRHVQGLPKLGEVPRIKRHPHYE